MNETSPSGRKIPSRRWFPALILLAAIAVIWAAAFLVLKWTSPLGKLRAAGQPTEFADLVPEPIPDERNAAAMLRDAHPALDRFNAMRGKVVADEDRSAFDLAVDEPLAAESLAIVKRSLASHAEATAAVDRALAAADYQSLCEATATEDALAILDAVQRLRTVGRLLRMRLAIAVAEGRGSDALTDFESMVRLGKWVEREPFNTPHLVAIAIQHTAMDAFDSLVERLNDPSDLDRADAALARVEDRSSIRWAMVSERVFVIHNVRKLGVMAWVVDRGGSLRVMNDMVALADLPLHEAIASPPTATGLGATLVGALQSVFTADARIQAMARGRRIRLAIRRAGLEADDTATAQGLELPEAVFKDPFTGGPLRIEHRGPTDDRVAGWWVWSVGENQRDDNGKLAGEWPGDLDDVGAAPPEDSSTGP